MLEFQTLGSIDLRASDGSEIRVITAQPKRLALLAYLALNNARGFHRRDTVIALLWPDLDARRGRAALSRLVYQLRNSLGAGAILSRGDDEIGLDFGMVRCDAVMLEHLSRSKEWRQALELYRGDLLPGFYASDVAVEFEQWLDERRSHFRHVAAHAAWQLAQKCESEDRTEAALQYARRYIALRPGEETVLRSAMQLFDRAGDKAAAAGVYKEFAARMAREFDLEPSPETRQLLQHIRQREPARGSAAPATRPNDTSPSGVDVPPGEQTAPAPQPQSTVIPADPGAALSVTSPVKRRAGMYAGAVTVVGLVALAFGLSRLTADRPFPTLAVADIRSTLPADSVSGFATLLNISLGRIDRVDVISDMRMREVRAAHPESSPLAIARFAGAREILDGVLSRPSSGLLRLDLRRLDASSGRIVGSYSVEGRTVFDLNDQITAQIASDFGVTAPATRPEGTTGSLVAYRLYDLGLHAYMTNDRAAAARLFKASLDEDSSFAMAAFYLSLSSDGPAIYENRDRAERLAEAAPDRDRWYIKSYLALAYSDRRAAVWADSLARRYPSDPDGLMLVGGIAIAEARWRDAKLAYERVVALDSVNARAGPRCRACEALSALASLHTLADSLNNAEQALRTWLVWQPRSPGAWRALGGWLERTDRFPEAHAAFDSAARYSGEPFAATMHASAWFRTGNFAALMRSNAEVASSTRADARPDALGGATILYRTLGRNAEALKAAREYRAIAGPSEGRRPSMTDALFEAAVLAEMGEPRRAAQLWDSIARFEPPARAPDREVIRAWWWVHAAGDYAAAGDTAQLARIEEQVRAATAGSLQLSHRLRANYIRGLRHAAQNQHAQAVVAFRRALTAREGNYVRIHRELARSLLALGRYREAVETLQYGLRGPISAAGLYATRTELQEMLAQAYDRNNQPDSALITYRLVLHAWQNADPQFSARKRRIEARVNTLLRTGPVPR